MLVTGLLVTGLLGYFLVTGTLRNKGGLRWDCFTGHGVYGSIVGCWLQVTGWWLADWLADWLINWSPCHVECVGSWTEGASVYKIDYHVSGPRSVTTNPDAYAYIFN